MNKKRYIVTEENVDYHSMRIAKWILRKVRTANASGVVLGMSGGVDCSLVAKLCELVDIDVHLIMMPYGDDMERSQSYNHSMELINSMKKVKYHTFDIKPAADSHFIDSSLIPENCSEQTLNLAKANVRPRVRMTHLYEYAQINNLLVIGTGNLSERTIGYFTKWGDGGCDFNPIGYALKREVYILSKHVGVPNSIINKKPSADLWPGQTDEGEIGVSYDMIDDFILNGTCGNIETDKMIAQKISRNRHKVKPIAIYNHS